uniref:Secreted protein n=1 Tax=Physcomitrium patens TaxID=3218 RepID=A0A2K1IVW3_PHYPA|nr:hypothetical protein PHYPA_025360 [Physcomitrium patens]
MSHLTHCRNCNSFVFFPIRLLSVFCSPLGMPKHVSSSKQSSCCVECKERSSNSYCCFCVRIFLMDGRSCVDKVSACCVY